MEPFHAITKGRREGWKEGVIDYGNIFSVEAKVKQHTSSLSTRTVLRIVICGAAPPTMISVVLPIESLPFSLEFLTRRTTLYLGFPDVLSPHTFRRFSLDMDSSHVSMRSGTAAALLTLMCVAGKAFFLLLLEREGERVDEIHREIEAEIREMSE